MCSIRLAHKLLSAGASLSITLMWVCTGVIVNAPAYAASTPQTKDIGEITIALPTFILSLLATAGFVWAISQYDRKQGERMNDIEERFAKQFEELSERIERKLEDRR